MLLDMELAGENHSVTFMMVDIDRFKRVNDEFNHKVGDVVLKETAKILLEIDRVAKIVVRYRPGGAFLVAWPNENGGESDEETKELHRKLNEKLAEVVPDHGTTTTIARVSGRGDVREVIEEIEGLMQAAKSGAENERGNSVMVKDETSGDIRKL